MANPNVDDRSDTSFYTGPLGNPTVLSVPVSYSDGDGNAVTYTVPVAATDAATNLTLTNAIRSQLIAAGILTAA